MERHVFCNHIKGLDGRQFRQGHGAGNVSIFLAVASTMNALCCEQSELEPLETGSDLRTYSINGTAANNLGVFCLFYLCDQIYYTYGSAFEILVVYCLTFFSPPERARGCMPEVNA